MPNPVVHAEIRSKNPDSTRAFFGELFGWTYPNEGAFPGYTFVETGVLAQNGIEEELAHRRESDG